MAQVKGLDELQRFLDALPVKLERNIMRGALRAGMKRVLPVAKSRVRSASGLLAAGLKISTRARGAVVSASIRATGRHAMVAKWVEFGTSAHIIASKVGKWLSFGGLFAKVVHHPGSRPQPFMRPALDSQAQNATIAAGEYVKTRLSKEGIDVGHIKVEGDD
jgi:HK97 gp10 family phage protein